MSSWPRWLPRPVDLAVAAALTALAEAELWLEHLGEPATRPVVAVSYTLILAVAWHRIAPLAALTTALVAAIVVPGALHVDPAAGLAWLIAALGIIASAGYHARRPLAALAITFGLLALGITVQKGFSPPDIVYAWLLCGGAWLAGRALAARTLRAELSEQRAAMAERDARAQAEAAVTEERLRIARELHDVVSHGISVMTLHVGGVRRLLGADHTEERAVLEAVERTGRESLVEMQRMLGVLRAPEAEEEGAAPGLGSVAALLEPVRAAGIAAELSVTGAVRPLPPGVDQAGYRIVQEALTNVLKHARASRVECRVDYGPAAVELSITDDGRGHGDAGALPGGHGHVGMRERAALYGGTVELGPRPGGGYAVRAVLPVTEPATELVRQEAR